MDLPHKQSVANTSVVCGWWGCVPMPMVVRSLAYRRCVFVFVCVCVCVCVCVSVLVGTQPSVSGKHCHSYINKPDRGDRHWVSRILGGEGREEG